MFERLRVHAEYPHVRHIRRAVTLLTQGLPAVVPTETTYALMCLAGASSARETIAAIRRLDAGHLWSLVCDDLSQASQYARLDNQSFRLLRRLLPGSYTFVLPASSQLPRRLFGKRHDIGIRMPAHPVCRMLLAELRQPLLATTLQFVGEDEPACDPDAFTQRLCQQHMVVLDAGWGGIVPTTVVDLCGEEPTVLRSGAGPWPPA